MWKSLKLSPTSWLTTKTVFSQVFGVLLFAVQAPLLGPRAFGLISVVMVFVGFCEVVLCEAAAESLISVRRIDDTHFDSMNTVIVAVSLFCSFIVFLGAEPAARWFGDAELAPILRWMSLLPVISAFAAAPTAATKRDMQFQPLAMRSIASLFIGGTVGLVLTLGGGGVWALVWQAIVTRVVASIVLWMAVPLRFRFGFSAASLGDLAHFALPVMLSRTMNWVTSQVPRLILGLYWGPTELGLYGLASRLNDIVLEVTVVPRYAVARVELRRYAIDRDGMQGAVNRLFVNMSVFCFPLCVGGAAVAPTLFHAWLDPRWYGGIFPAELLLLMCVPFVTHYCVGAALLAFNQQRPEALISVAQMVATLAAVLIFAPLGLNTATAAIAIRPLVLLPLPVWLLGRQCQVRMSTILLAQLPALTAAGAMGLGIWLLRLALQSHVGSLLLLLILTATGAGIYSGLIVVLMPDFAKQFAERCGLRRGRAVT